VAIDTSLAEVFALVLPRLDERQRRVVLGAHAKVRGWGGISGVASAAGVSRPTVQRAVAELDEPAAEVALGRIRQPGAGRKPLEEKDPNLVAALEALVEPDSRGDPESPLRWTCKSTRELARTLTEQGHPVGHTVVAELLQGLGYSLQGNAKVQEGRQHPDRDAQFRYLNEHVKESLDKGLPVVSVDTKKKELVGNFKNPGRQWRPKGEPELVNVHDFPEPGVHKAIPYGIYDLGRDSGWVNVGQDHDTASFAVESLRRWWLSVGQGAYPDARQLLICADGGGSNGHRPRLWKWELSRFATEFDMEVTVCHFPPGTSKWNRIEHRLWSQVSMNWRGQPLISHEVVVDLIGATKTRTGLTVHAQLDRGLYPKGVKVSDKAMAELSQSVNRHEFHGDWNYTILPSRAP
jgi:hypothetical protein